MRATTGSSSRSAARRLGAALVLCVVGVLAAAPAALGPEEEARLREAARLRGAALAAMEDGDFRTAAGRLERLAEILPDNVLPPIDLAICYLRLDRVDEALSQVRRARRLDPDNPQMLYTLARVLEGRSESAAEWSSVLDHFAAVHPADPRPHYLRARAAMTGGDHAAAVEALERALERAPENLVLMADLLVESADLGDPQRAEDALYAIEDRLNGLDGALADYAEKILAAVDAGEVAALRPAAQVVRNLLRPTDLYGIGLQPLVGGRQAGGALFPQRDFDPPLPPSIQGGQDIEIAFVETGRSSALEALPPVARTLPMVHGDRDALWVGHAGGWSLLTHGDDGFETTPIDGVPAAVGPAAGYDVDQDGIADLTTSDAVGAIRLSTGQPAGGFAPPVVVHPGGGEPLATLTPLDVDHDGDLDFLATRREGPPLYLLNQGGGGWSERAAELGLPSSTGGGEAASADFDDDGDLDLLLTRPSARPSLHLNRRSGALVEPSRPWGLDSLPAGVDSARVADFDGDGRFDVVSWGAGGAAVVRGTEAGFEPLALPAAVAAPWRAAAVGDFDNDADPDVVAVVGESAWLVRNRRTELVAEETDLDAAGVRHLESGDFDADGDLDLLAVDAAGALRWWSNEGGDRNGWVRLRLRGRNDNNAKNNTEGLFTRIEARIGDHLQLWLGNGGFNHLGLGARREIDVLRVVWTNGLAQSWLQVGTDRTLVEEQVLKGSCPFLYSWNGERFDFVTDLMWKSPLGMILADGTPAPHQSARDWVLVPGEALRPVGGELWLQITEELWETAYVDRVRLLAVDHPLSSELVVDERFLPPPHPRRPPLHLLGELRRPVAAADLAGRDVLERLEARDGVHVDQLPLDRYQGLTRGHGLEISFADVPADRALRLVLAGWIFPTDTTINYAVSQDSSRRVRPPALEVLEPEGSWRLLEEFIGFPNGKRKQMVVDLTGRLPEGRVTLRLTTNMQIYWDSAALAIGLPAQEPRVTPLEPAAAELHYRGYSRLYRESPSGPHLFDYSTVAVEPRFRDMRGAFTRFGPVTELLIAEDDRYVVMNAGDEMTVRFDADLLPAVPPGWRRDWVLYTDGWVKDGDLHTRHSQTVAPLPYHGMSAYPDAPTHEFPDDAAHRGWRDRYQTRGVDDQPFREAVVASPP